MYGCLTNVRAFAGQAGAAFQFPHTPVPVPRHECHMYGFSNRVRAFAGRAGAALICLHIAVPDPRHECNINGFSNRARAFAGRPGAAFHFPHTAVQDPRHECKCIVFKIESALSRVGRTPLPFSAHCGTRGSFLWGRVPSPHGGSLGRRPLGAFVGEGALADRKSVV